MECECGRGGGKWPPASTESQEAERARAGAPPPGSRKEQGHADSEVGWDREGRRAVSTRRAQRWLEQAFDVDFAQWEHPGPSW